MCSTQPRYVAACTKYLLRTYLIGRYVHHGADSSKRSSTPRSFHGRHLVDVSKHPLPQQPMRHRHRVERFPGAWLVATEARCMNGSAPFDDAQPQCSANEAFVSLCLSLPICGRGGNTTGRSVSMGVLWNLGSTTTAMRQTHSHQGPEYGVDSVKTYPLARGQEIDASCRPLHELQAYPGSTGPSPKSHWRTKMAAWHQGPDRPMRIPKWHLPRPRTASAFARPTTMRANSCIIMFNGSIQTL